MKTKISAMDVARLKYAVKCLYDAANNMERAVDELKGMENTDLMAYGLIAQFQELEDAISRVEITVITNANKVNAEYEKENKVLKLDGCPKDVVEKYKRAENAIYEALYNIADVAKQAAEKPDQKDGTGKTGKGLDDGIYR